ncbi:uncharacterized protein At4g02000-like [Salvia miltiorrhiza]|uniref:uncharacterized protein At4g02000-like n=1 Tax=Salvia miltiorrhiza TaxID=226208 RepID=UPI0025ACBA9F|nr:uncharacterized protein At4g02000-like [Salvia miltiorrhiza]
MEDHMAGLNLANEDDELLLDDAITGDSSIAVELCLVGKFLTDQPINFNLMRSRLASIWRPGKGVFMKDIGQGRFIFQFFHEIDLQRVADGGPWAFGNFPLMLHRLKRGEFPLTVPLETLPFWIQVHDLPAGYLTEGVGRLLGNFIGNFLEYDSTNASGVWRQYMRIRVGIRISEPLKRFKRIKQKDGSSFVVNFRYERLNIFCFLCGRLGHSESFCELMFNPISKNVEREWGVWLKAADRRGVNLAGDKWLRTDDTMANPSGAAADARVSKEPSVTDPIISTQENRGLIVAHNVSHDLRMSIPQAQQRLALTEISHNYGNTSMQIDGANPTCIEERKRRRGAASASVDTNFSSDVFPAGFVEDGTDDQSSLSAGSGFGAGRAQ